MGNLWHTSTSSSTLLRLLKPRPITLPAVGLSQERPTTKSGIDKYIYRVLSRILNRSEKPVGGGGPTEFRIIVNMLRYYTTYSDLQECVH